MAHSDRKGAMRTIGKKKWAEGLGKQQAEVVEKIDRGVNIEVGDFISELATAIRYQDRTGLTEGDWVEEPERLFTDNRVFGEEEKIAANVKLQVTLSIDCSFSMWKNGIMMNAGRAAIALDRYLRRAQQDLPEGALSYCAFAWAMGRWGTKAYTAPSEWMKNLEGSEGYVAHGAGADTRIAPLFKLIEKWETENSDPNALRLDIIITDGVLEHRDDVVQATQIQERRNGRLTTALLNFLPRDQWNNYQLPDRCFQYPVTPKTLTTTIRTIISESIGELS